LARNGSSSANGSGEIRAASTAAEPRQAAAFCLTGASIRTAPPTVSHSPKPGSGVGERLVRMAEDQRQRRKAALPIRRKAEPFALVGVYDVWKGDGERAITSFAIVHHRCSTERRADNHNRMPVVLEDSTI